MAPRVIRVSRHGLTRCPACQTHIQIAADVRQTSCPFCQAALLATQPPESTIGSLVKGALATGRSGLLAASLLGLSVGAAACGEEEDPPAEDTAQAADVQDTADNGGVALYGVAPDTIDETDTTTSPSDTSVEDAADNGAVALYGIAPDDVSTEDTADSENVALYGIAPSDTSP